MLVSVDSVITVTEFQRLRKSDGNALLITNEGDQNAPAFIKITRLLVARLYNGFVHYNARVLDWYLGRTTGGGRVLFSPHSFALLVYISISLFTTIQILLLGNLWEKALGFALN